MFEREEGGKKTYPAVFLCKLTAHVDFLEWVDGLRLGAATRIPDIVMAGLFATACLSTTEWTVWQ